MVTVALWCTFIVLTITGQQLCLAASERLSSIMGFLVEFVLTEGVRMLK